MRKQSFKQFLKGKISKVVAVCMVMSLTMVPAFAAEAGETGGVDTAAITSAFTTGLNNVVTTSISLISAMLRSR